MNERAVTLVCGPPCGGKSTWVREHAAPADLVVCFDLLARAAGSRHAHRHTHEQRTRAGAAWRRACAQLATSDRTAWVVRCAATAAEREHLAAHIRADRVVVLLPPMPVALARAHAARREPRIPGAIRHWYAAYTASAGDLVIPTGPPAW